MGLVTADLPFSLFSAAQVQRLTGLSSRQLSYWDHTEFFRPAYVGGPGERFGRVYSFEDVVGLRAIALMRKYVALQELRRVGLWLHDHRGSWAGTTFWIRGMRVFWEDDAGIRIGTRQPHQAEMPIAMDKVNEDMRVAIARLRKRPSAQVGRVDKQRYVVGHQSTVAGTRIPTRAVWRLHEAGYSHAAIRREYPRLTNRDIDAALDLEGRQRAS
jgi:uncharacterized protein (DUF433 family)